MELFFLCCGLHGAFVLILSAPTRSGPRAVVWNTRTRHCCCSVTLVLLSVLVQTALSTSSAASGRCSRISSSRGLVEGLVLLQALSVGDSCASLLPSFSTWFRRVSGVAVASLRLPQALPFFRGVLSARVSCALRSLTWPPASRARGTDFLSPLRRFACVAVPTQCLLVLDLVLRPVDGEFDVELGTVCCGSLES